MSCTTFYTSTPFQDADLVVIFNSLHQSHAPVTVLDLDFVPEHHHRHRVHERLRPHNYNLLPPLFLSTSLTFFSVQASSRTTSRNTLLRSALVVAFVLFLGLARYFDLIGVSSLVTGIQHHKPACPALREPSARISLLFSLEPPSSGSFLLHLAFSIFSGFSFLLYFIFSITFRLPPSPLLTLSSRTVSLYLLLSSLEQAYESLLPELSSSSCVRSISPSLHLSISPILSPPLPLSTPIEYEVRKWDLHSTKEKYRNEHRLAQTDSPSYTGAALPASLTIVAVLVPSEHLSRVRLPKKKIFHLVSSLSLSQFLLISFIFH